MSQPRGRYPGPRDKRPRQSQQPSNPVSHRPNKTYAKASPARETEHTASIFKTRSFKWLVDTVGAENIALGLDSSLSRVTELTNGVRFTPETAFHIETTLGLPDGFFDQPNPALTAEIIDRLKAPLDFARAHAESEPDNDGPSDATASILANNTLPADHLPRETDMPKKTHDVSQPVVAKTGPSRAKPAGNPASESASTKGKPPIKRGAQQSLLLNEEIPVQDIRRANLHVLTARKGSKVRLAVVMEISASNLDNRLYGQKRMDDAEANRFTERLGLPTAWLDVPRVVTDIPEAVSALLDPQAGRPASDPTPVAVTEPEVTVAKKSVARKTKVQGNSDAPPSDVNANSEVVVPQLAEQQEPTPLPDIERPVIQTADAEVPPPASHQQPELPSVNEITAQSQRCAPVTSLDDLVGIAPIAEALIKTLAGKARTGRLDEMKALALLQQIVAL